jgi:hypothetical protein
MKVFTYTLYNSGQHCGFFTASFTPQQLTELFYTARTVPGSEYEMAMTEFASCIKKLNSGTPVSMIFANSALSGEVIAVYLLSADNAVKQLIQQGSYAGLHVVFEVRHDEAGNTRVTSKAIPGPAQQAPETAVDTWLQQFVSGS